LDLIDFLKLTHANNLFFTLGCTVFIIQNSNPALLGETGVHMKATIAIQ